jgi:D-mannonate dehydratase
MSRQKRIKGGEKNIKSGQKWTKEELNKVLQLYISDRQLKIHESNEIVQKLAKQLGRTTRSVEAQLLMFRTLDKFGNSGYKNMNTICKQLWEEFIDSTLVTKK